MSCIIIIDFFFILFIVDETSEFGAVASNISVDTWKKDLPDSNTSTKRKLSNIEFGLKNCSSLESPSKDVSNIVVSKDNLQIDIPSLNETLEKGIGGTSLSSTVDHLDSLSARTILKNPSVCRNDNLVESKVNFDKRNRLIEKTVSTCNLTDSSVEDIGVSHPSNVNSCGYISGTETEAYRLARDQSKEMHSLVLNNVSFDRSIERTDEVVSHNKNLSPKSKGITEFPQNFKSCPLYESDADSSNKKNSVGSEETVNSNEEELVLSRETKEEPVLSGETSNMCEKEQARSGGTRFSSEEEHLPSDGIHRSTGQEKVRSREMLNSSEQEQVLSGGIDSSKAEQVLSEGIFHSNKKDRVLSGEIFNSNKEEQVLSCGTLDSMNVELISDDFNVDACRKQSKETFTSDHSVINIEEDSALCRNRESKYSSLLPFNQSIESTKSNKKTCLDRNLDRFYNRNVQYDKTFTVNSLNLEESSGINNSGSLDIENTTHRKPLEKPIDEVSHGVCEKQLNNVVNSMQVVNESDHVDKHNRLNSDLIINQILNDVSCDIEMEASVDSFYKESLYFDKSLVNKFYFKRRSKDNKNCFNVNKENMPSRLRKFELCKKIKNTQNITINFDDISYLNVDEVAENSLNILDSFVSTENVEIVLGCLKKSVKECSGNDNVLFSDWDNEESLNCGSAQEITDETLDAARIRFSSNVVSIPQEGIAQSNGKICRNEMSLFESDTEEIKDSPDSPLSEENNLVIEMTCEGVQEDKADSEHQSGSYSLIDVHNQTKGNFISEQERIKTSENSFVNNVDSSEKLEESVCNITELSGRNSQYQTDYGQDRASPTGIPSYHRGMVNFGKLIDLQYIKKSGPPNLFNECESFRNIDKNNSFFDSRVNTVDSSSCATADGNNSNDDRSTDDNVAANKRFGNGLDEFNPLSPGNGTYVTSENKTCSLKSPVLKSCEKINVSDGEDNRIRWEGPGNFKLNFYTELDDSEMPSDTFYGKSFSNYNEADNDITDAPTKKKCPESWNVITPNIKPPRLESEMISCKTNAFECSLDYWHDYARLNPKPKVNNLITNKGRYKNI